MYPYAKFASLSEFSNFTSIDLKARHIGLSPNSSSSLTLKIKEDRNNHETEEEGKGGGERTLIKCFFSPALHL